MSKTKQPTIRIIDAWLLRENVSRHLHELWGKGQKLADDEWMEARVKSYRAAWKAYEDKILNGLDNITKLQYNLY